MMHNEITHQDEAVVRFNYKFEMSDQARRTPGVPRYVDRAGSRNGQALYVGVDLPKSVADKLRATIKSDPNEARTFVEQLVNDGSLNPTPNPGNINVFEKAWFEGNTDVKLSTPNPIRPPYPALKPLETQREDPWQLTIREGIEANEPRHGKEHNIKDITNSQLCFAPAAA